MPRSARVKSYDSIYHIMCKSINNAPLFKDFKDRDRYLRLVKKYQERLEFKVYGYCLMTTHVHMIIDCNGADISKIMHGINQCYAQYFNIRHNRNGHVFKDRFKSKIVKDDNYLITLSAYIHNNPSDIRKYKKCPETFYHSSFGVYLGIKSDEYEILDEGFIMGMMDSDVKKAREKYFRMVLAAKDPEMIREFEFKNDKSEYRSERMILVRNLNPEKIMDFVAAFVDIEVEELHRKNRKESTEGRALCAFLIRCYSDLHYRDICEIIGGITLSRISGMVSKGVELIKGDDRFRNFEKEFLSLRGAL